MVTPTFKVSNFNDRLDIDDEEDSLGAWIYKQSRMAKAAVAAGVKTPVPSESRTGVESPRSEYQVKPTAAHGTRDLSAQGGGRKNKYGREVSSRTSVTPRHWGHPESQQSG